MADQIIVIQDGRIIERGSHADSDPFRTYA